MIQASFMDWLGSNLAGMMFALSMLFVIMLIIYIKLFVRIFYKGTLYRHYRKGRLLTESDKGGMVALIPFLDRLEVFDEESTEFDGYFDES
nr:MAG: hypothetical protein AM325_05090 [Candidatus Thorarchaeota archaeon SMTZ1-45]